MDPRPYPGEDAIYLPETEPSPVRFLIVDVDRKLGTELELGCFLALTQDGQDHRYTLVNMFERGGSLRLVLAPFTESGPVTIKRTSQSRLRFEKQGKPSGERHQWERNHIERWWWCRNCKRIVADNEILLLTSELSDEIRDSPCPVKPTTGEPTTCDTSS